MTEIGLGRAGRNPLLRRAMVAAGVALRSGGRRLIHVLWFERTIQWQILAALIFINFAAAIAAAGVIISSKQRDTRIEMAASVEVAERLVRSTIEQLARDTGGSALRTFPLYQIETLPLQIRNLRHVRVFMFDANEHRVSRLPTPDESQQDRERSSVPSWFLSLFHFDNPRREIPVMFRGEQVGTVFVVGQAFDEIAEAWQDLTDVAPIVLVADAAVIGLLCLVVGQALTPLTNLATGLKELEQGRFRYRLPSLKVRQLADIIERFNALASVLQETTMDNVRLNRRLITVQDDERRQIASELHDELGSYLFGLRMNLLSLQRLIDTLPPDAVGPARERVGMLVGLGEQIQTANRTLLKRIRPMAIGRAPLADVIADLVTEFERNDPDHAFVSHIGQVHRSYGDCIDLTVYRCIQEGVTNAVRHGRASTVTISVEQQAAPLPRSEGSSASAVLRLSVNDDGCGLEPGTQAGIGLTGMEERVRALGGTFAISNGRGHGACLEIAIPVEAAEWSRSESAGAGTSCRTQLL
jgi:two-component system, NarL family, sensor histidine kinase UhpB